MKYRNAKIALKKVKDQMHSDDSLDKKWQVSKGIGTFWMVMGFIKSLTAQRYNVDHIPAEHSSSKGDFWRPPHMMEFRGRLREEEALQMLHFPW